MAANNNSNNQEIDPDWLKDLLAAGKPSSLDCADMREVMAIQRGLKQICKDPVRSEVHISIVVYPPAQRRRVQLEEERDS